MLGCFVCRGIVVCRGVVVCRDVEMGVERGIEGVLKEVLKGRCMVCVAKRSARPLLFYYLFSKSELTNCFLLNSCRASIDSPRPIYFTGTLSWSLMPMTTPPLAVPSSLVMAREVTGVTAANCLACSKAFCPVLPSSTSMTSSGAVGTTFFMTSLIFFSSFIRPTLL